MMPWKSEADHVAYQKKYNREHREEQSARKAARRAAERRWGSAAIEGKDIDHIRPLDKGGSNASSNLRIRSQAANRGFARDRRNQPK